MRRRPPTTLKTERSVDEKNLERLSPFKKMSKREESPGKSETQRKKVAE
jgi:hypothetical protein